MTDVEDAFFQKRVLFFRKKIMEWAQTERRPMPWKYEKDPYKVWLSEIILQQTRVEQGTAYYLRFIEQYPDVHALASAPLNDVLKLWQGLGYNSRARNLHTAAKQIIDMFEGSFPRSFEDILSLRGVGQYTASAISAFAFQQPYAVLDGNVTRIISRYFDFHKPVDERSEHKRYSQIAQSLLDENQPGKFNQAIMDFGALVCKPAQPLCTECPLMNKCLAFSNNTVHELPKKKTKKKKRSRYFYYFVFYDEKGLFLKKRTGKDIWQEMYDFPLWESNQRVTVKKAVEQKQKEIGVDFKLVEKKEEILTFKQELTHQKIFSFFIEIKLKPELHNCLSNAVYFEKKVLSLLPIPGTISWYLKKTI